MVKVQPVPLVAKKVEERPLLVLQVLAVDFSFLRFFLGDKAGVQGDVQI